jgi:prepilin-type N-terminal cleavage/methylation domain-containing protein
MIWLVRLFERLLPKQGCINRMKSCRGFSFIELIVAMGVGAIIAYFAVPELYTIQASYKRLNSKSDVLQDIKLAQAYSITEGCRGVLKIDTDANGYTFGCDYLSYDTANPPSHDTVYSRRTLPSRVSISVSGPVIFNSRGQSIDTSYTMTNRTITLTDTDIGVFATGLLYGTGVFTFEES